MMDFGKSYRHSTIDFYASVSLQFQLDFFFRDRDTGDMKYTSVPQNNLAVLVFMQT